MEALRNLLHLLGIGPLWASIIILLSGTQSGLIFLAKANARCATKTAANSLRKREFQAECWFVAEIKKG